ncbi:hypothetical protein Tco_0248279 [Tanacetum coccineum]
MTLELANHEICTPVEIARDVFVPVGKFTFLADFVIVDYESDSCVTTLGKTFLNGSPLVHLIDVLWRRNDLRDVNEDFFDPEEDIIENLLNLDKTKDLPPYHDNQLNNPSSPLPPFHNSLSGSTTSSSHRNDDLPFDAESDLREIEYLLNHVPIKGMDSILEDSVEENSLDDNLEEKIKDSKILIDELDLPGSSDFLPFPECDSVFFEDFSEVDTLPSTNNADKVFNPGSSGLGALLSFSSENEEKVFNPEILTSKRVHTSLLPELSHRALKLSKSLKILKARWRFFLALMERTLYFGCSMSPFIPLDKLKISQILKPLVLSVFPSFTRASNPQLHFGNLISKSYRLTFIFKHYIIKRLGYLAEPS